MINVTITSLLVGIIFLFFKQFHCSTPYLGIIALIAPLNLAITNRDLFSNRYMYTQLVSKQASLLLRLIKQYSSHHIDKKQEVALSDDKSMIGMMGTEQTIQEYFGRTTAHGDQLCKNMEGYIKK